MAPASVPNPKLRIRQVFNENGPTHTELLGICIGSICASLLVFFVCWKIVRNLRNRRYWQAASPTVRYEATGLSPTQLTFPLNDKEIQPAKRSTEASLDATTVTTVPSPVYDALKAGRPPSYRTSVLIWREATARENAVETSTDRP